MSVSPSEPTSYIKQNLQEFQESALYSNYVFETVDNRIISDYVEIANYAPTSEDICTMTIHLVPAQYDVKKSRQQLKRVRDIISYPPTLTGVSFEKDVVADANTETTEAADPVTVLKDDSSDAAELGSAVVCEDDALKVETILRGETVVDEKVVLDQKVSASEVEKACEESSAESKEVHVVVDADKLELIKEVASSRGEVDSDASEKKIDFDSDASNTASSEVKENCPVTEEIVETKIPVELKTFAPEDDGIKVTAIEDEIAATEAPNILLSKRRLPSGEEIFAPVSLGSFFKEVLLRVGSAEEHSKKGAEGKGSIVRVKEPSECVKSVSASGWNPPPMSRASQGDLLYIEAVTGTHITSFDVYFNFLTIPHYCVAMLIIYFYSRNPSVYHFLK